MNINPCFSAPRNTLREKTSAWLVAVLWCALPLVQAAPALPTVCQNGACGGKSFLGYGSASIRTSAPVDTMIIDQQSNSAILNWQTFNIGAGGTVQFVQPGSGAVALNRIFDQNPSEIQGRLVANGQVYLVNPNGILFGKGAQVDTAALVASALGIKDNLFLNGLTSDPTSSDPVFAWDEQAASKPFKGVKITVESGANINAAKGGFVMLLGPNVENYGNVHTPDGQTVLAAGAKVYLAAPGEATTDLRGFLVEVDPYQIKDTSGAVTGLVGGTVVNGKNCAKDPANKHCADFSRATSPNVDTIGQIIAEHGNISLVGWAVNQNGRVSATTSVNLNGSIYLRARDSMNGEILNSEAIGGKRTGDVLLGEGSVTTVTADVTDDQTTVANGTAKTTFHPSVVDVDGATITMEANSRIVAPGGTVTLTAETTRQKTFETTGNAPQANTRIYLDHGSVIDVSGSQQVAVSSDHDLVTVELRGDELKDSPLQRNGVLRNKQVVVDASLGTPIADISGWVNQIPRTVGELTANGGMVNLRSQGDVIQRGGSTIEVSGGTIQHEAGYHQTTQLVSDGQVYDITTASPDRVYQGIIPVDGVKNHAKWGVQEHYNAPGLSRFVAAYTQGKDAGTVQVNAHNFVREGEMVAHTSPGPQQRTPATLPKQGQLILGDASTNDYSLPNIVFAARPDQLPGDFTATSVLPEAQQQRIVVSSDLFEQGGFNGIAAYSHGTVTVPSGLSVHVAEGGNITLAGRAVTVDGNLDAPGGTINLATKDVALHPGDAPPRDSDYRLTIGAGAQIAARGEWVNDAPVLNPNGVQGPVYVNGGSIAMSSVSDLELGTGSVLDVSGGGWLQANGKLAAGNAGSIALSVGNRGLTDVKDKQKSVLMLGGELRGYALGQGGKLSLTASNVRIGGTATGTPGELWLTPDFFQRGGFSRYSVSGVDGATLTEGTQAAPRVTSLVLNPGAAAARSGDDIYSLTTPQVLPLPQRAPANLSLSTANPSHGDVVIEHDSAIQVDPTGAIALSAAHDMTVYGDLSAPAGRINLAIPSDPTQNDRYEAGQSIWLAAGSHLSATGYAQVLSDDLGNRNGEVLPGGQVTVNAQKGYVVTETGSTIDVSGASATVDIPRVGAGPQTTTVASAGGAITLQAREGLLLDGTLKGAPGQGGTAAGGSLTVVLARRPVDLNTSYPSEPTVLTVDASGAAVPAGLRPGDVIPNNGQGIVFADRIREGGFDRLTLRGDHAISFDQSVNLNLRQAIVLDAPVLRAQPGVDVQLNAAYVALGNQQGQTIAQNAVTDGQASGGTARLNVHASQLDLVGHQALQGFKDVQLRSDGDLRLIGTWPSDGANNPHATLSGAFNTAADALTLQGQVIYPSTLSQFEVNSSAADGTLTVLPVAGDHPVLSAAGTLTLRANHIDQQGVLKAPFGVITLNAADSLTLAPGSVTSVSAENQVIPFGMTQVSGHDYAYAVSGDKTFVYLQGQDNAWIAQTALNRNVVLNGPHVNMAKGATIDVSGGGDMRAYEFVPGPGGSKDVLAPENSANTFAVIPGMGTGFAPYDTQTQLGVTGLQPGDGVYLAGVPGLPAGNYTLLPARYAMLPGAFLVTAVSGYRDLAPGQAAHLLDGTPVVAGYRTDVAADGTLLHDTRTSGFAVRPGSDARTRSEYIDTLASAYFANTEGVTLPGDAGKVSVVAGLSMTLEGGLRGAHASGFRGAELDVSADKLAIESGIQAAPGSGYVTLDADALTNLHASSVLLGGHRVKGADGVTTLYVDASNVVVDNAGAPLVAPEIILAATDAVTVKAGSVIHAEGEAAGGPKQMAIKNTQTPGTDADGALLRVSAGAPSVLTRDSANVKEQKGTLTIEGARMDADGKLVAPTASVYASQSLDMDGTLDVAVPGVVQVANQGYLSIGSGHITLGTTDGTPVKGLQFTQEQLAAWSRLNGVTLRSYHGIDVWGGVDVGSDKLNLTLQGAGLQGHAWAGGNSATLRADTLTLSNPGAAQFDTGETTGSGDLTLQANKIVLGAGDTAIRGFAKVNANAAQDIVAQDKGTFTAQGADLNFTASRILAVGGADQQWTADGAVNIARPDSTSIDLATTPGLGARLQITGTRIVDVGTIELPSGSVTLHATGATADDGVTLTANAKINAAGVAKHFGDAVAYAPGGVVTLQSDHGDVTLAKDASGSAATIDVSAPEGGDAGALVVSAPEGKFNYNGAVLKGTANASGAYQQGAFQLDAQTLDSFSALADTLRANGFTEAVQLRVRTGDVAIANDVKAHQFALSIDQGAIVVSGKIDASGAKGGTIDLQASGDATIQSGAVLDAHATDATSGSAGTAGRGGQITLATTAGQLDVQAGSTLNVSRGPGDKGMDGSVLLRAPRNATNDDMNIKSLAGKIVGAGTVTLEAFKTYNASTLSASGATVAGGNFNTSTGTQGTAYKDATAFVNAKAAILSRLNASVPNIHLRPGIEVDSTGDLTLANDWDLSKWRFAGEPVNLTLRTAGALNLNASLSDGFTTSAGKLILGTTPSAAYRLVGGADLNAADVLAVRPGDAGDVALAGGTLVRTGTGFIDVAAGHDVVLGDPSSQSPAVIYTAGTASALPQGIIFQPLAGTFYPEKGGDITIRAQNDVNGVAADRLVNDWLYRSVRNTGNNLRPNPQTNWWPSIPQFAEGVGALGGGDITVIAGRDINSLSASIPTNGRLTGSQLAANPTLNQLMILGGGDLTVLAGRNVIAGAYFVAQGQGKIAARGSVVADPADARTVLAMMGTASLDVNAGGSLAIETVYNPTVQKQPAGSTGTSSGAVQENYFYTYDANSAVTLTAASGDVSLKAADDLIKQKRGGNEITNDFPPILHIAALQGDVRGDQITINIYPSVNSDLLLLAGRSVEGLTVTLSDVDPAALPQVLTPALHPETWSINDPYAYGNTSATIEHLNESLNADRFVIWADKGDVSGWAGASFSLRRPVLLHAGGNISNLILSAQNLHDSDITRVEAGGDIRYDVGRNPNGSFVIQGNGTGIDVYGPGQLQVISGGSINLGATSGIVTHGNAINPKLPVGGASVQVIAGANLSDRKSFDVNAFEQFIAKPNSGFYDQYRTLAIEYVKRTVPPPAGSAQWADDEAFSTFAKLPSASQSEVLTRMLFDVLRTTGRDAKKVTSPFVNNYDRAYQAIAALFPERENSGDISLYFSQIKTEQGGDIDLLAPHGGVNAGLANTSGFAKKADQLGIVSVAGGNVRGMVRDDFMVNQSRVFTLQGGDILLWSSDGGIDAGKGSKTASATPPPRVVLKDGKFVLDTLQSVAGSGIGVLKGNDSVVPGDVDLIAPKGTVNAGDAGIRATGNLTIAAQKVQGGDNIRVGGASIGVPASDVGAVSAGLSGASNLASGTNKAADDATRQLGKNDAADKAAFKQSFLTVEFIGFDN